MLAHAHRIGAVCYLLWGILHLGAGAWLLYVQGTEGGVAALAAIGSAVPPAELPQQWPGVAGGVLSQHAWNLAWFGGLVSVVAVWLNWRNSRTGYWINLTVVSAADLGYIVAILLPGYARLSEGLPGPVLWLLAVVFSTLGLRRAPVRA